MLSAAAVAASPPSPSLTTLLIAHDPMRMSDEMASLASAASNNIISVSSSGASDASQRSADEKCAPHPVHPEKQQTGGGAA